MSHLQHCCVLYNAGSVAAAVHKPVVTQLVLPFAENEHLGSLSTPKGQAGGHRVQSPFYVPEKEIRSAAHIGSAPSSQQCNACYYVAFCSQAKKLREVQTCAESPADQNM